MALARPSARSESAEAITRVHLGKTVPSGTHQVTSPLDRVCDFASGPRSAPARGPNLQAELVRGRGMGSGGWAGTSRSGRAKVKAVLTSWRTWASGSSSPAENPGRHHRGHCSQNSEMEVWAFPTGLGMEETQVNTPFLLAWVSGSLGRSPGAPGELRGSPVSAALGVRRS